MNLEEKKSIVELLVNSFRARYKKDEWIGDEPFLTLIDEMLKVHSFTDDLSSEDSARFDYWLIQTLKGVLKH